MFYMYNSFVAFKIPPLLQAEASLIPGGGLPEKLGGVVQHAS